MSNNYFNLNSNGFGFVNRLRIVEPRKGKPYFSCVIQANRSGNEKSRFEIRVVGGEAKEIFQRLVEKYPDLLNKNSSIPVRIGFRLGDLVPDLFNIKDDNQVITKQVPCIDARLLKVNFLIVGDEHFYVNPAFDMKDKNIDYKRIDADGLGFVNNIRVIQPDGEDSFIACTIQAFHGNENEKSRFNVRILGGKAKELFQSLIEYAPELIEPNNKNRPTVCMGFKVSELEPNFYEVKDKNNNGQVKQVPCIDCRLDQIKFINLAGNRWYDKPKPEQVEQ